jgi:hypothetical protein
LEAYEDVQKICDALLDDPLASLSGKNGRQVKADDESSSAILRSHPRMPARWQAANQTAGRRSADFFQILLSRF